MSDELYQVQRRGCENCCKQSDPCSLEEAIEIANKVEDKTRLIIRNMTTGEIVRVYPVIAEDASVTSLVRRVVDIRDEEQRLRRRLADEFTPIKSAILNEGNKLVDYTNNPWGWRLLQGNFKIRVEGTTYEEFDVGTSAANADGSVMAFPHGSKVVFLSEAKRTLTYGRG